jgi:hypothetical protein
MIVNSNCLKVKMSKGNIFLRDEKFNCWIEWEKAFGIIGMRIIDLFLVNGV